MAVRDPQNLLGMELSPIEEKYKDFTRALYIKGKPELQGSLPERVLDSLSLRAFGLVLKIGHKEPVIEREYWRLTRNFDRMGRVASRLRVLGPVLRVFLWLMMRTGSNAIVRQYLHNEAKNGDFIEAARGYLKILDVSDMDVEVCSVSNDEVVFKFLKCPIGYVGGDDMKICMATNKYDRQCVRAQGARMLVEELISEGAPACLCHIVSSDRKVPDKWRRYSRFTI